MRLGLGLGRHRFQGGLVTPPPPPPPPVAPAGFALNESGNLAVKAMLARVVHGAGRGRIVFKGDSTTAGAGGGDAASPVQLAGARSNRTSAVLASLPKVSGDVLLVFPHPAGGAFATNTAAYRDAIASFATSNTVAFLSLFDCFGGVFLPELQARMADGLVHGTGNFYAEVADVYRRSIAVMGA